MALDTYDNLKLAIADMLDRPDLTAQIDDFIDLAEARHKRDIRIREMLTRAALTIDARFVSVPTGYVEALIIRILTDEAANTVADHKIDEVNLDEMTRIMRPDLNKIPEKFTIHSDIEFDVTPDQDYGGEIIFYAELTALSSGNQTNALLTRAPDAYLYAALVASAPHLMHDERLSMWSDLYGATRDTLNKAARRSRHAGALVSRPAGTTP